MRKRILAALSAAILATFAFVAINQIPAQADPPLENCFTQLTTCGYPTTATTGPRNGHTLTPYTPGGGDFHSTSTNQVIEDLDITGCLVVDDPGVIVRDVRFQGDCFAYIETVGSGTVTIEYTEIICNGGGTGVAFSDVTITNSHIRRCENGVSAGSNVTITDSINEAYEATPEEHGDLIQGWEGENVLIDGNLLSGYNPMTSAIIIDADGTTDWTITNNFLSSGAYTLYCPTSNVDGFVVTGNRFYPAGEDATTRETDRRSPAFGMTTDCDTAGITWSGNITDLGDTLNDDGTVS